MAITTARPRPTEEPRREGRVRGVGGRDGDDDLDVLGHHGNAPADLGEGGGNVDRGQAGPGRQQQDVPVDRIEFTKSWNQ